MDNNDEIRNLDNSTNNGTSVILARKVCPYCEKEYTSFQMARRHIYTRHQKNIASRSTADHGLLVHAYNDKNIRKYTQAGVRIIDKLTCITCVSVFDNKSDLASHVEESHLIQIPTPDHLSAENRWVIHGQDISSKFRQYQRPCIKDSNTTTFAMDTNFNELLSMSGILVLQRRHDYQILPSNIFSPTILKDMHQHNIDKYHRQSVSPTILCQVNTIIQNIVNDDISERKGMIQLLSLCENASRDECSVIDAIVALIPHVYDCDMKSLSEAHLTSSYIHSFVHGLLSTKTPTAVAHCSNIVADEVKDTNNRPDYKVDIYSPGYQYAYTNGYGEVKTCNDKSPTLLVNDFYRLAIFSKDALDTFNLNQVLAFQTVGNCVVFFAMSLSFPQLYTFTEIARINIPTKRSDLVNLVGNLDSCMLVSSVHKDYCTPADRDCSADRCLTLPSAYLDNIKGNLAPRKRPCGLTLDH